MTVDPLLLIGVIGALGGLLLFVARAFTTGVIHPRNTVPREDYEALRLVNASYAEGFAALTAAVKRLADTVDRIVPPNGGR